MNSLPARACDNGLYVAACSAVGDNGKGNVFGGGMMVLDPKGNIISEYYGTDEHSITVDIGGKLPRDGPETMSNISYFDRRRPELYRSDLLGLVVHDRGDEVIQLLEPLNMDEIYMVRPVPHAVHKTCLQQRSQSTVGPLGIETEQPIREG